MCCRCLYKRSLLAHLDDEEPTAQGAAPSEQRNWTGGLEALHDAPDAVGDVARAPALRTRERMPAVPSSAKLASARAVLSWFRALPLVAQSVLPLPFSIRCWRATRMQANALRCNLW